MWSLCLKRLLLLARQPHGFLYGTHSSNSLNTGAQHFTLIINIFHNCMTITQFIYLFISFFLCKAWWSEPFLTTLYFGWGPETLYLECNFEIELDNNPYQWALIWASLTVLFGAKASLSLIFRRETRLWLNFLPHLKRLSRPNGLGLALCLSHWRPYFQCSTVFLGLFSVWACEHALSRWQLVCHFGGRCALLHMKSKQNTWIHSPQCHM